MSFYSERMFSDDRFSKKQDYNRDYKEKSNPRKRSFNRFSAYCKALCKQSLITGFPTIASTRNVPHKTLKIFVFALCICGFLYQTTSFLRLYNAYPTMVDIHIENPDVVDLPALSLCNRNRIRRKELCTQMPNVCAWFTNRSLFCIAYPKYCISWQTSDKDTVLGV
ncbi:uncharacterized protein TNCT_697161, partial [Trichonephila clavata]